MATRNLEDAIFKLESGSSWPEPVLDQVSTVDGVKEVVRDKNDTRLVVTYDRRKTAVETIQAVFDQNDLKTTLLNEVNHRQHQTTLSNEEKEVETP